MEVADSRERYRQPRLHDYGDLVALTNAAHLLYGSAAASPVHDLSFSGSVAGGGGTSGAGTVQASGTTGAAGTQTATPGATGHAPTSPIAAAGPGPGSPGGGASTGAPSGGGGGSGLGSGGGSLPFTGYPAAMVAALGAGLVAGGAALRRAVRPTRRG